MRMGCVGGVRWSPLPPAILSAVQSAPPPRDMAEAFHFPGALLQKWDPAIRPYCWVAGAPIPLLELVGLLLVGKSSTFASQP